MNFSIKSLLTACLVVSATFFLSCSDEFLEPSVPGALTSSAIQGPAGIENSVIGAYAQLSGRATRFGSYNWVTGSIQGGEANKGTTSDDFVDINEVVEFRLTPSSSIPNTKWTNFYAGAVAADAALRLALESEDPAVVANQDFRDNMAGQAIFLRSHYFFELWRHYKNFVYFDETIDPLTFGEIPNTDRFDQVVLDMERAVGLLPETQSAVGMVNKSAGKAYLGKMLMYQGKFAEAAVVLQDVIDNGVTSGGATLDLVANYSDVFNAEFDNNEESIFAIQAAANTGSVNNANYAFDLSHLQGTSIGGCCGFWQPSFDLVNSFRVDANGLPLSDGSYRSNGLDNDLGVESSDAFTPDAGPLDPRLDHSVGRRGIPYLDWGIHPGKSWVRDQAHAGPYAPKKFIYYQRQTGTLQDGSSWTGGYTAVNFNIIRFADVLLMAAECYAQTDNLPAALALVNRVRTRAANPDAFVKLDDGSNAANYQISNYPAFADKADALQKIYFERKLELSNEGHRFYDLVRWDMVDSVMPSLLDYEQQFLPLQYGGANFNPSQDKYFPIPQSQLDLQPVLTQNPGYN